MPDNKDKRGAPNRREVAGGEGYEVEYLAKKHGLSVEQAQALIKQHGNDRAKLDAAAKKLAG